MALLTFHYQSVALMRSVTVEAILPTDKWNFLPTGNLFDYANSPDHAFKSLYLLHGIFGDCSDWLTQTGIQQYANDHNLAVFMPSGENGFYCDLPFPNANYGTFVGEELVEMTRRMFPLSHRREDTFIGGLSMGGFGALRNGLKYYDTFCAIVALSAAVHIFEEKPDETSKHALRDSGMIFGDLDTAVKTDSNPSVCLEKLVKEKKELPKVFMACGTEDSLLSANRSFHEKLVKAGADVTYIEEHGIHNWEFWDRNIKRAIDEFLPVDGSSIGFSSGHVKEEK